MSDRVSYRIVTLIFCIVLCLSSQAHAEKLASIIIDDLGYNLERGRQVVELPAKITLSILPKTKHAKSIAELAHSNDKEVMLHQPLQSIENHNHAPGTLDMHMTREQFSAVLADNVTSIPYVSGINNHMGSLLTMHPGHMTWLMQDIQQTGNLYFVDSRTSSKTVAETIAKENYVPALQRDVFLDPDFRHSTMKRQFKKFIDIVHKQGYAIAIAHPHPRTLQFLKSHLHELAENDIRVVPVSEMIAALQSDGDTYVTCIGPTCSGL